MLPSDSNTDSPLPTNYTWAKAIDTYGGGAFANVGQQDPQNPFDLRADRGRNESDLRHRWVSAYLYELPFLRGNQWYARAFGGWKTDVA